MHVYGPSQLHGAQPINAPHTARVSRSPAADAGFPVQDELQLSGEAKLIDQVRDLPDIREERVARIRAEIARGTYETEEKVSVAVGRLLDEIG